MNGPSARGRPRKPETDRAILDAAVELLVSGGYESLTMEAVAAASAISRPTVYRRYANREALLEAAVNHVMAAIPIVGEARDGAAEVRALLGNTVLMLTRTPVGPIFRAMIPHLPRYPALARIANELGQKRRQKLRRAFARGRRDGSLVSDKPTDAIIDGVLGAVYFRFFITGRRLDEGYAQDLLVALL